MEGEPEKQLQSVSARLYRTAPPQRATRDAAMALSEMQYQNSQLLPSSGNSRQKTQLTKYAYPEICTLPAAARTNQNLEQQQKPVTEQEIIEGFDARRIVDN